VVYVLKDGREVHDIGDGKTTLDPVTGRPFEVTGWRPITAAAAVYLPDEVLAAEQVLKTLPGKAAACLDLHQDHFGVIPYSYAFKFDQDENQYRPIVARIARAVTVLTNVDNEGHSLLMDSYEATGFPLGGNGTAGRPAQKETRSVAQEEGFRERFNALGFIVHHDGAFPSLFERQGVEHCVTVETSVVTPLDQAREVYRAWIEGIADLLALRGSDN
jgi:hypothetical protein